MALRELHAALLQERKDVLHDIGVKELQQRALNLPRFGSPEKPSRQKKASGLVPVRRSVRQAAGPASPSVDPDWYDDDLDDEEGGSRKRKRNGASTHANALGPDGTNPSLRSLLETLAAVRCNEVLQSVHRH